MKRITTTQLMLAVPLLASPAVVLAHPGHDHEAWSSPLFHLAFFASLVAVIAVGGLLLRKRASAPSHNEVK